MPAPCGVLGLVVVTVALANTTVFLSGGSKTTAFPALVDRVGDPVDPSVPPDSLVVGVDEDDFVVFVDTVLVDPVRL